MIEEYTEYFLEHENDESHNDDSQNNSSPSLNDTSILVTTSHSLGNLFSSHNESNKHDLDEIKYTYSIDHKIIEICESIYNCENNQIHRYTDMETFLISCIKLIQDLLKLINTINSAVGENSNYYLNEDFKDNLEQELKKFFKKFNDECNNIVYFYYDEHGKKLLHDLCLLFSEHLEFDYSIDNFDNSEFLYSDIQFSFKLIEFNLELYKKKKYEQFKNIKNSKRKSIGWNGFNILKQITDFFYSSSNEVTLYNQSNEQKKKEPIITNVIQWKDTEIKVQNEYLIESM